MRLSGAAARTTMAQEAPARVQQPLALMLLLPVCCMFLLVWSTAQVCRQNLVWFNLGLCIHVIPAQVAARVAGSGTL